MQGAAAPSVALVNQQPLVDTKGSSDDRQLIIIIIARLIGL